MQVHSLKLPLNKKVQIYSPKVACAASVSAGVRRESWDESKKKKDNFRAVTRLETLATQATLKVPKKLLEIF